MTEGGGLLPAPKKRNNSPEEVTTQTASSRSLPPTWYQQQKLAFWLGLRCVGPISLCETAVEWCAGIIPLRYLNVATLFTQTTMPRPTIQTIHSYWLGQNSSGYWRKIRLQNQPACRPHHLAQRNDDYDCRADLGAQRGQSGHQRFCGARLQPETPAWHEDARRFCFRRVR